MESVQPLQGTGNFPSIYSIIRYVILHIYALTCMRTIIWKVFLKWRKNKIKYNKNNSPEHLNPKTLKQKTKSVEAL
jgi:hypothetical protein